MKKTAILVSGGFLEKELVSSVLSSIEDVILIGVDGGLDFLYENHWEPDYIVGDFDSLDSDVERMYANHPNQVRLHPVKDATDTEEALHLAVSLGVEKILLLGGTGGRLDHFWGNVQSLWIPFSKGISAKMIDVQNEIFLWGAGPLLSLKKEEGSYFSLFPLGEEAVILDIQGAKYPLEQHPLSPRNSLGVSNEWEEEEVRILLHSGTAVVMKTRDRKEKLCFD